MLLDLMPVAFAFVLLHKTLQVYATEDPINLVEKLWCNVPTSVGRSATNFGTPVSQIPKEDGKKKLEAFIRSPKGRKRFQCVLGSKVPSNADN